MMTGTKAQQVMFAALIAHAEMLAAAFVKRTAQRAADPEPGDDLFAPMFASITDTTGLRQEAEEMLAAAAALGLDQYIPAWDWLIRQAEEDAIPADQRESMI